MHSYFILTAVSFCVARWSGSLDQLRLNQKLSNNNSRTLVYYSNNGFGGNLFIIAAGAILGLTAGLLGWLKIL
jgi:hypothetical protein